MCVIALTVTLVKYISPRFLKLWVLYNLNAQPSANKTQYEGRVALAPNAALNPEPEVTSPTYTPVTPSTTKQVIAYMNPSYVNYSNVPTPVEIITAPTPSIRPVDNSYASSSTQRPQDLAISASASHDSMTRSAGLTEALSEDSQILPGSDFFAWLETLAGCSITCIVYIVTY